MRQGARPASARVPLASPLRPLTSSIPPAQPLLGKVYKGLHALQAKLGLKLLDVRSSINLAPLTPEELDCAVSRALLHTLQQQGWRCLGRGLMLKQDFLAAAPGEAATALAARLSGSAQAPQSVLVTVADAGWQQSDHRPPRLASPACNERAGLSCHAK